MPLNNIAAGELACHLGHKIDRDLFWWHLEMVLILAACPYAPLKAPCCRDRQGLACTRNNNRWQRGPYCQKLRIIGLLRDVYLLKIVCFLLGKYIRGGIIAMIGKNFSLLEREQVSVVVLTREAVES